MPMYKHSVIHQNWNDCNFFLPRVPAKKKFWNAKVKRYSRGSHFSAPTVDAVISKSHQKLDNSIHISRFNFRALFCSKNSIIDIVGHLKLTYDLFGLTYLLDCLLVCSFIRSANDTFSSNEQIKTRIIFLRHRLQWSFVKFVPLLALFFWKCEHVRVCNCALVFSLHII